MKRARIFPFSVLFALTVVGGWAWGGIEGSKHDFSNQAWSGGDACGACHVPHREEAPKAAPLWDSGADLTRRFGTPTTSKAVAGSGTLLCIRCHDGTMASDIVSGQGTEPFRNTKHPGVFKSGHQVSNHPVGVEYPRVGQDYHPATTVVAKGAVTLPDGKVECTSCHDPHNGADAAHMLVMSNQRSALCLTCHKK